MVTRPKVCFTRWVWSFIIMNALQCSLYEWVPYSDLHDLFHTAKIFQSKTIPIQCEHSCNGNMLFELHTHPFFLFTTRSTYSMIVILNIFRLLNSNKNKYI